MTNHFDVDDFFKSNAVPFSIGVSEARVLVQRRKAGEVFGYKMPILGLEHYIRFIPKEFVIIGARSGTGKTAMMMQIAQGIEKQRIDRGEDKLLVVFSAEMDKASLALRLAAAKTGVSVADVLENDNLPVEKLDDVDRALQLVAQEMQVYVDETSAPSLEHMSEQLSVLQVERPIAAVMFDYMELAGGYKNYPKENQRVNEISKGLKRLAKKFDCPVVALSQLNRDIEGRLDKVPRMSDLMQGGERDPDRIIMLVRDDDDPTLIRAHVVKNRNAPLGSVPLKFDGKRMEFQGAKLVRTELID